MTIDNGRVDDERMAYLQSRHVAVQAMAQEDGVRCDDRIGTGDKRFLHALERMFGFGHALFCHAGESDVSFVLPTLAQLTESHNPSQALVA